MVLILIVIHARRAVNLIYLLNVFWVVEYVLYAKTTLRRGINSFLQMNPGKIKLFKSKQLVDTEAGLTCKTISYSDSYFILHTQL